MQKKSFLQKALLALSVIVAGLCTTVAQAEDRVLNIYNWSDYIDDSILKDFSKETGIKVNYDVFDSNELLETKLLAGSSGYDLVVPSATFLSRQIKAGVFQPLDKSRLKHLDATWDTITELTAQFDPENAYSVNYFWGTTGIGYVEEKIKEILGDDAPVDSLDLMFKPEIVEKLASCGIHWLDAPIELLPMAETYLGNDPGKTNKDSLKQIEALVAKVRPHIKKFHSSEYISALANGDICLAVGWSGDIFQAQARAEEAKNGVTVKYYIPKEGAQMWFDQMAMPADSKNVDAAYEFLNYIMQPEVIAKSSNYVAYANGNKASQAFVDKELLENPAIYPTKEVMARLFTMRPYEGKMQRLVNRTWTRIKSGR